MRLFSEKEIKIIKDVFQKYIKEHKNIQDDTDLIETLMNSSDFTQEQYKIISKIITAYIKEDGSINTKNIKEIILEIENFEKKDRTVITIIVIVAVIVGIIAFVIIGNINAAERTSSMVKENSKNIQQTLDSYKELTMEKFNKIKSNMTYSEVCNIIGFEGTLTSEYGNEQIGITKIYIWSKSGKDITISFINNKVTSKLQNGL
jgi:hypothetical protein